VYLTGGDFKRAAQFAQESRVRTAVELRPGRHSAVLLMGQFATHGGLSKALFPLRQRVHGPSQGRGGDGGRRRLRRLRRICGSSLATAATMGQVALPELRRFGYSGALGDGRARRRRHAGHHDPPSVPLVIYAILTQESIGKLFMAAVIPASSRCWIHCW